MRINHNIAALNTYRQLNSASTAQGKSMEKLSSGLRINKAGDDAAGLAISEKMRGQIRGLDMASKNSQDGISMLQTAEGALNETHDILQRMKELATQAANDTNTTDDRGEIQKEINQLTSEINRIGNTTEFNTQKLLDGGEVQRASQTSTSTGTTTPAKVEGTEVDATAAAALDFTVTNLDFEVNGTAISLDSDAYTNIGDVATAIQDALTADGNTDVTVTAEDDKLVFTAAEGKNVEIGAATTGSLSDIGIEEGTTEPTTAGGTGASAESFSATLQIGANKGQAFQIDISDMRAVALGIAQATDGSGASTGTTTPAKVEGTEVDATAAAALDFTVTNLDFEVNGTAISLDSDAYTNIGDVATAIQDALTADGNTDVTVTAEDDKLVFTAAEGKNVEIGAATTGSLSDIGIEEGTTEPTTAGGTGASTVFTTDPSVTNGTASNLGEKALDVSTHANATNAIEVLDKAIAEVSGERSKLGAYQNRLEHTINNLNTSSENLTAAESRIRDVDYALAA
ncbi:flagellin [Bacillus infantis]|uniref:Flagellin n=1 Tax=Bacillus infantis TaxID=324767 RepID=A0A5D4RLF6_9BACI|nr:flagellin [Bacillus infantis]TYS50272.1 hypothetical protein FZD51_06920 [Bacillus infantis]